MKIKITADSTCDLSKELIEKGLWKVVALIQDVPKTSLHPFFCQHLFYNLNSVRIYVISPQSAYTSLQLKLHCPVFSLSVFTVHPRLKTRRCQH